ncbi:MAG: hypothetical protein OXC31_30445 [Spirochaetaceae bacterium]|nr:hypothetical protein [Spirochaetaceae bacterium]
MLIPLTTEKERKLLINPDHIVSIEASRGVSVLTLAVPAQYDAAPRRGQY